MNVQVTIPQLFYDLIARVIPGFFFLKTWEIVFGQEALGFESANNWAEVTFSGIAFIAICYLIGWLLSSPAYFFEMLKSHSLKNYDASKIQGNPEKWGDHTKYDWVRLFHEPTGYRIVKLRAERRMLKSALAGAVLIIILILLSPFLSYLKDMEGLFEVDYPFLKSIVLALVIMGFMVGVFKLNMQYYRSVRNHFWLLWQMKQDEKKNADTSIMQENK